MPLRKKSSPPFAQTVIAIWQNVLKTARRHVWRGTAEVVAAHLPICCMCLVPTTDDPFMAARNVPMVGPVTHDWSQVPTQILTVENPLQPL